MARLGAICAAVVAATLTSVGPASAADAIGCTAAGCFHAAGRGAGYGRWFADGDKMRVCDTYPDGLSVVVLAKVNGVSQPRKWHTAGAGGQDSPGLCTDRSYGNLREGATVEFWVCVGDFSQGWIDLDSCGTTIHASA
jgi:hypothetical protein